MTVRTRAEAVRRALAATTYTPNMCLRWVRTQYGIPGGTPDAATAWRNARHRHPGPTTQTPPRGVPVFWTGGSSGHGHVAISLGNGQIRTTDWPSAGRIGTTTITELTRRWGLKYEGWTEDLNGVRIPTPPPPAPAKTRGPRIDQALDLLRRARTIARNKNQPIRRRRLTTAIKALATMKERTK